MSNVLMFPLSVKEVSLFAKVKNFLDSEKIKKEKRYKIKLAVLRRETYFWYLERVFKSQSENEVDLPLFIYMAGNVLSLKAKRLTEKAIQEAESQGRHHIEKCYKKLIGG